MNLFFKGFRAMLPITTGIMPFGAVMGTVSAEAQLTLFETVAMNVFVFAGAAQMAAVDLMLQQTELVVVIVTGLIINIRFMLYSAAMSPIVQNSNIITKFFTAYLLTDQNYTVMTTYGGDLKDSEKLIYYFGASICMVICWHGSVILGFAFGNFAPPAMSLDFAVPLCFVAMTMMSMKNWKYVLVAVFAAMMSLILYHMPYNLGLITTALMGISLGAYITSGSKDD